jgi:polysaccharide biosynthesis transport protein
MMHDELESETHAPVRGLSDYWAMAVRRRWTIVLPLFLCWVAVWGVSWFLPSTYTSEALILVEQQKIPEQYVVPNVTETLQDRLQSMTEQILSRTRLQSTIDRYQLYKMAKVDRAFSAGDPVSTMRKDIKIEPVNSSVHPGELTAFKISYSSGSPLLAEQVNNDLTSLFIEEDLKSQQQLSEGTTAFLQSQLADAKAKLEEQEGKVRAFKARHFGDLPSQSETNISILSGLQNQLQSTDQALDGARQQKLYLDSLLQQYQTAHASLGTPDSPNQSLVELTKELDVLQAQLADARVRLTDEHPDVVALKEKIARTEKLKKDLEAQIISHQNTTKTANAIDPVVTADVARGAATPMMQVQSQLKAVGLEIQNYEQHAKDLETQIASYRARLNMTPQTEQELAEVSRGYEESKANYNSLLQKQNQSELATSLQEREQGQQFRVLDPPSLPRRPSAPNRLLLSAGGLLSGAVLGLGLAVFLEIKNEVVRKEQDLEGLIPTHVLVGIPHLQIPGEDKSRTIFRWLEIGAMSLIVVMILAGNFLAFRKG